MSTPVEAALTGYGHTVSPEASATEAARTLRDADDPILVVEDDGIEGVVTETDFVEMVADPADSTSVTDLMSSPPVTAAPLTSLSTVLERMHRHDVDRVLVVDSAAPTTDDTYWGFVSTRSVAEHFADTDLDVRSDAAASASATATAAVTSD